MRPRSQNGEAQAMIYHSEICFLVDLLVVAAEITIE
jgi:hypothetical protein